MKKRFGWMGAVWSVVFVMCGVARAYDLNQGLIAYYPLTTNAVDASGNGMDGTVMSGVTFTNGTAVFDGTTNAWIDLPDGFDNFTNGFSFTGWVRYDSFDENYSRVFDFSLGPANNNIILSHLGLTNSLNYAVLNTPALTRADFYEQSQWVHVALIHDTNGAVSVYRDGLDLNISYTASLPNVVVRTNNYIGRSAWSVDGYLKGALKELRFYNRPLERQEVLATSNPNPKTIYVSKAGNRTAPYTSWASAADDLVYALLEAKAGDTVLVGNGTFFLDPYYAETGLSQLTIPEMVTIKSVNGPDVTIFDGNSHTLSGFAMEGLAKLEGVSIIDASDHAVIGVNDPSENIVSNCVIRDCRSESPGDSLVRGVSLFNCVIQDNEGFNAAAVSDSWLYNCLILNNKAFISAAGGLANSVAVNCTIVGNGHLYPTPTSGGVDSSVLTNCVVYGNTVSGSTLVNSCYAGATQGVDGNITNTPVFADEKHDNYRLAYGSPGVDAGLNGATVGPDLDGLSRIINSTVDMGAYEMIDTDGDQLSDAQERMVFETDPEVPDSDGDGYDDGYEVQLGLSPTINNTAFLGAYVQSNANAYGYYDTNSVLDLHVGDIGMAVSNGTANLSLQMEASNDLNNWTNAGDSVSWTFPVDSSNKFFRVRAEP